MCVCCVLLLNFRFARIFIGFDKKIFLCCSIGAYCGTKTPTPGPGTKMTWPHGSAARATSPTNATHHPSASCRPQSNNISGAHSPQVGGSRGTSQRTHTHISSEGADRYLQPPAFLSADHVHASQEPLHLWKSFQKNVPQRVRVSQPMEVRTHGIHRRTVHTLLGTAP